MYTPKQILLNQCHYIGQYACTLSLHSYQHCRYGHISYWLLRPPPPVSQLLISPGGQYAMDGRASYRFLGHHALQYLGSAIRPITSHAGEWPWCVGGVYARWTSIVDDISRGSETTNKKFIDASVKFTLQSIVPSALRTHTIHRACTHIHTHTRTNSHTYM
jgi:hypothetical protein